MPRRLALIAITGLVGSLAFGPSASAVTARFTTVGGWDTRAILPTEPTSPSAIDASTIMILSIRDDGSYAIGSVWIEAVSVDRTFLSPVDDASAGDWDGADAGSLPQSEGGSVVTTPEPSTAALMALGLAGLLALGRRGRG
jgi:hypothetical protein